MADPTVPYSYNVSPTPQGGTGPFGLVPGQVALPQPALDLSAQIPGLAATTAQGGQNIYSQMLGRLSPGMMAQLQDAAATQANVGGMPGSNKLLGSLYGNFDLLKNILSSEQLQQMGLQNYNQFVPTVSKTQTVSPELQAQIAMRNATMAAAPSPAAAASYAESLFNRYMSRFVSGGAGGTGGYRIVGGLPGAPEKPLPPSATYPAPTAAYGTRAMDTTPTPMTRDQWLASIGLGGGGIGGGGFGLPAGGIPTTASGATEDFWDALGLGTPTGSTYMGPLEGAPAEVPTPGVDITQPGGTESAPVEFQDVLGDVYNL